jgi:hypothetical protein
MSKISKILIPILLLSLCAPAFAGKRDQARKLYSSLTGLTPTEAEVTIIAGKLAAGKSMEVAQDIIDSRAGLVSKGAFYNVTVKNFATPWTNVDYTKMFPLTDLSATVIGYVRDNRPFNDILHNNSVYMAAGIKMSGKVNTTSVTNPSQMLYTNSSSRRDGVTAAQIADDCEGVPVCTFCKQIPLADRRGRVIFVDPLISNGTEKLCTYTTMTYSNFVYGRSNDRYYIPHLDTSLSTNLIKHTNAHFDDIENQGLRLDDSRLLVHKSQEVRLHQDAQAISGLFTTRAWGKANMTAGTNRRSFQSAMANFFCKEMMDINDTNTPDYRVRQDLDRSPGGDSATFKNLCVGCHAVMDSHMGAFAYYDFPDGAIVYNQGAVVAKMTHNAIFPEGFITQDDGWVNNSLEGQNASFEWGALPGGQGVNSLASMYSETKEFHRCMAKQVYKTVCYKDAVSALEKDLVSKLSTYYQNDNFNMKNLFMKTSLACMGQ